MRLRWVAGFVVVSSVMLTTLSIIRNETGNVDPGYYSLSAEVARFSDKPDPVTVMNNDQQNTDTLLLATKVAAGSAR
ncbi:hypothetical protein [Shewanella sp. GXUN23E]|uniref:hypothetical protein n=1 Tax=Shewanella sp. GXUN23E TaxID=3422498 RepID=UPI003D7DBD3B